MKLYKDFVSSNIFLGLLSHMCAQGYACAQERSKKALNSYLWLIWRLCIVRKWKLRPNCKLLGECWRHAPTCTYSPWAGGIWFPALPHYIQNVHFSTKNYKTWKEIRKYGHTQGKKINRICPWGSPDMGLKKTLNQLF